MTIVTDTERIRQIIAGTRTIAVLGISDAHHRAGYYVPEYLHARGYRIRGVNPNLAGQELFGNAVVATLAAIDEPIDLVDVFRRPETLPEHRSEILALDPLPKVVWLQSGIRHPEVAGSLSQAGIEVVEDRCLYADHRRLM